MIRKFVSGINLKFFLWSILVALLFLVLKGYQFNSGDQAEHLPQVYKLMNPSLYKGDFFMSYYQGAFTVRFFYVWMMYALTFIAPIEFWAFTLTIFFIAFGVYGFMRITKYFSTDILSAYISPIFILIIFYEWTIGGNNITYSTLICSTIAKSFGVWAFYEFFKGKYYRSAFFSGIATLFQVMVGAQIFFIIILLIFFRKDKINWFKILNYSLLFFIISSAMLFPMVYKQLLVPTTFNKDLYYSILFDFRNPGHFIPSSFPIADYVRFCLLIMAGIITSIKLKLQNTGSYLRLILISISGMILFILGIEILGIYAIAKTQWFKTSIWVAALSCIPLSVLISINIRKFIQVPKLERLITPVASAGIVTLIFILICSQYIPVNAIQGRYQAGFYEKTDLAKMHTWIALNTPVDALFVIPPENNSFGCESRRPTVANFKAIIHEPWFMIPWYYRIRETYCVELSDLGQERTALEIAISNYKNKNCLLDHASFKPDYRLDNKAECKFVSDLGPLIHAEGNWILTKVR